MLFGLLADSVAKMSQITRPRAFHAPVREGDERCTAAPSGPLTIHCGIKTSIILSKSGHNMFHIKEKSRISSIWQEQPKTRRKTKQSTRQVWRQWAQQSSLSPCWGCVVVKNCSDSPSNSAKGGCSSWSCSYSGWSWARQEYEACRFLPSKCNEAVCWYDTYFGQLTEYLR